MEEQADNHVSKNAEGQEGGRVGPDSQNRGGEQAPEKNPAAENLGRSDVVDQEQGGTNGENGWTIRNPMKSVIPSQARKKLTPAERASRALITEANKTARAHLMQDIDAFLEDRANKIDDLAVKHSVKQDYIKKLINPTTTYKKQRAPTLPNAIMHIKAVEINEGELCV
jgi:hypothetical protein